MTLKAAHGVAWRCKAGRGTVRRGSVKQGVALHSKARLSKESGHSRLRTVSLKYHVSHTGYGSAVCGAYSTVLCSSVTPCAVW